MDERSMAAAPAEMAPIGGRTRSAGDGAGIEDPRALTILTTEHWSLLSARSLVYNEAFARAGMFLAFLSATLVALGLVATATAFSDAFLVVAAVVLGLNLFIGIATLGRISGASMEDIRYLQGMNRIRHAYHEMVPGLTPYFSTNHHDDVGSVLSLYGSGVATESKLASAFHGLTTIPSMITIICCALSGVLVSIVLLIAIDNPGAAVPAGLAGLAVFVVLALASIAMSVRIVIASTSRLEARFPAPPDEEAPPATART
jgi:hypothetical protein